MKLVKRMLGVTLLEIMLVLAIASMIILMSVRYYNSATRAQQTTAILALIQNITAAADSLAQGPTAYSAVTSTALTSLVGSGGMITPVGGAVTVTPIGPSSYSVSIASVPAAVCAALAIQVTANARFTTPACSATTGAVNFTYTYVATN